MQNNELLEVGNLVSKEDYNIYCEIVTLLKWNTIRVAVNQEHILSVAA